MIPPDAQRAMSKRCNRTGSNPDIVKPGVAGRSMKSPASSVRGRWPSTVKRQLPRSLGSQSMGEVIRTMAVKSLAYITSTPKQ
jgi:hypothetical protein